MPERVVTRAFIENEKKQVLVGLRARGIGANQWALIGGKPDDGESPEAAIVREVAEELETVFEDPQIYLEEVDSETDPANPWRVFFFTGVMRGTPNPKQDEIREIKYIGEADLETLDIAFDHKSRLREFFRLANNT